MIREWIIIQVKSVCLQERGPSTQGLPTPPPPPTPLVQYEAHTVGKEAIGTIRLKSVLVFNVFIISIWKFVITSDTNAAKVAIIQRLRRVMEVG